MSGGQVKTTATSTTSRCETVKGCNFKDAETTREVDVCTLERRDAEATAAPDVTDVPEAEPATELLARADNEPDWKCKEKDGKDYIMLLRNLKKPDQHTKIRKILERRKKELENRGMKGGFFEVRSDKMDITAFFYVYNLGPLGKDFFRTLPEVLPNAPIF